MINAVSLPFWAFFTGIVKQEGKEKATQGKVPENMLAMKRESRS